jgi:CDP-diacylglycerol---serine O-phosphatidyltransferase
MLPIYVGLLGVPLGHTMVLLSCGYTVFVAALLVSRLPVYSGKASGLRVRRDLVVPLMLVIVFYVALLFSYTWLTLTVSVLAYLVFLPVSLRAYRLREAQAQVPKTG